MDSCGGLGGKLSLEWILQALPGSWTLFMV